MFVTYIFITYIYYAMDDYYALKKRVKELSFLIFWPENPP